MPDKDISKFLIAARQKFDVADFLYKNTTYYLECIYLAGYTIECAFKALILSRISKNEREDYRKKYFHGGNAHKYGVLIGWLKEHCEISLNTRIADAVQKATWSVDLRYETEQKDAGDAEEFLDAAKTILNWVEGVLHVHSGKDKKRRNKKNRRSDKKTLP
jgi:HEPN domain-containing protein